MTAIRNLWAAYLRSTTLPLPEEISAVRNGIPLVPTLILPQWYARSHGRDIPDVLLPTVRSQQRYTRIHDLWERLHIPASSQHPRMLHWLFVHSLYHYKSRSDIKVCRHWLQKLRFSLQPLKFSSTDLGNLAYMSKPLHPEVIQWLFRQGFRVHMPFWTKIPEGLVNTLQTRYPGAFHEALQLAVHNVLEDGHSGAPEEFPTLAPVFLHRLHLLRAKYPTFQRVQYIARDPDPSHRRGKAWEYLCYHILKDAPQLATSDAALYCKEMESEQSYHEIALGTAPYVSVAK